MAANIDMTPRAAQLVEQLGDISVDIFRAVEGDSSPLSSTERFAEEKGLVEGGKVVPPPYDPEKLAHWPEYSTVLPQCINALVANIEGWGHSWEPLFDEGDIPALADEERARGEQFFRSCGLEYPFLELRARTRRDLETIGWAGWELVRDSAGTLVGLEHVPARSLRVGHRTPPVLVTRKVRTPDGTGWYDRGAWQRPRLYVQISGTKKLWFKEPGDPRAIDAATGDILGPEADPSNPQHARELLWFSTYNPRSPYGVPRWIGTSISISGSRSADEVNWHFFQNNAIPPLVFMLYGASLTPESQKRFAEQFNARKGVENYFRAMILNAKPQAGGPMAGMDPSSTNTMKMELKEITAGREKDGLFQDYDQRNRMKVRSACGLPPIFIGESEEYTRATAQVSMEVAERTTFKPARMLIDDRINRFILSDLELLHWRFRSRGPSLTNTEEVNQLVEAGVKSGAVSPNVAAGVLSQALGQDIPLVDEHWANLPMPLVTAAISAGLLSLGEDEGQIDISPELDVDRVASVVARMRAVMQGESCWDRVADETGTD